MIAIDHLTKEFSNQKGLFDVSIQVEKGQIFGYLGPNGAGKSTTIRHLLGYIKPQKGQAKINGFDCWSEADKIHSTLGYLPGEIAFIEGMSAIDFLNLMSGMRKLSSSHKREELIERFDLDIRVPVKKMSKGMKQKLAIISAFMHDPDVIILDEPSSGLDPLMQKEFVNLLHEEKNKGKTILISSHIFSELEDTADVIAIIRKGRIIKIQDVHSLRGEMTKDSYEIEFYNQEDVNRIVNSNLTVKSYAGNKAIIAVDREINEIFGQLSQYKIKTFDVPHQRLEDIFMKYYYNEEEHS
ncbi:ABC-2 type transport system ATP-binding protein [Paenibacillus sophorae]|uniref:ABC transporter ATP-binding protein n=1 Tax=Paenibacillus sophorae TaxID=1333845 RepID=A0A1H8PPD1_9BACL|nr:ABC transporter ATP-binding protein [Paenibacillus sophorae]QWU16640.1 ABC transporter ATP-binding protein [Paenibacillus sophorae]SEO43534.1 ABC-2 type transport system ATP-binding protein [Paenibacillus sophorae]